jgi:FkbM family methyltransferase
MNYYGHMGLDKFLHEKYFVNKRDGVAIEAGAFDGISMSTCKVFEEIGWKCYNIEPNPILFGRLVNNRPQSTNIQVALSNESGTSIFEVGKKVKTGRLIGKDAILEWDRKVNPRNASQRRGTYKYEVKTTTYKNIISEYGIKQVDLFVLDIEGWETQVIRGMEDCDVLPDVFCVEALPSMTNVVKYEDVIQEVFKGKYKKDSACWLNEIYIKNKGI